MVAANTATQRLNCTYRKIVIKSTFQHNNTPCRHFLTFQKAELAIFLYYVLSGYDEYSYVLCTTMTVLAGEHILNTLYIN